MKMLKRHVPSVHAIANASYMCSLVLRGKPRNEATFQCSKTKYPKFYSKVFFIRDFLLLNIKW